MAIGFIVVLVCCFGLGLAVVGGSLSASSSPPIRAALVTCSGVIVMHALLQALSAFGVRWASCWILLPAVAALGLASLRRTAGPTDRVAPGWGDAFCAAALAIVGVFAAKLWITTADFVYHWGVKGRKFFLASGIDYEYLSRPWNVLAVPWYPTTLSELYAASALISREWSAGEMMMWSVLWIVLIAAAARGTLQRSGVFAADMQWGMALLGGSMGTLAIALRLAGGADWMIALAVLLGVSPYLEHESATAISNRNDLLCVAVAAAFAAASKVEGTVLGAILIAAKVTHDSLRDRRVAIKGLVAIAFPFATVVGINVAQNGRLGLRLPAVNLPSLERVAEIAPATTAALADRPLYGLPLLALAAIPLLLSKRGRWAAGIVLLQLSSYFFVYAVSSGSLHFYIATTLHRLLVHVIPAVIVILLVVTCAPSRQESRAESAGLS